MLKNKLQIHMDAAIVVILLLIASVVFNFYQKQQYSETLQELIDQKWKVEALESQLTFFKIKYKIPSEKEISEKQ